MSTRLGWDFHIEDAEWRGDRKLYIVRREYMGAGGITTALVTALPLLVLDEAAGIPADEPTLRETRNERQDNIGDVTGFLQAAMDAAWQLGLRPRGFADHSNELTAVRYHLEDMRKIAKVPGAV